MRVNEQDRDIYEIFEEQFVKNTALISRTIVDLQSEEKFKFGVNTLFRIFHGLKANSSHFHFEPMIAFASKAEKILSSLRDIEGPADETIIEWFEKGLQQCYIWQNEMQNDADEFSKVNTWLLESVVFEESESLTSVLKKRSVVYFDSNKVHQEQIKAEIQNLVKTFISTGSFASYERALDEQRPDICIVNVGDNTLQAFAMFQKYIPDGAFITILETVDKKIALKFGLKEIYHIIKAPIGLEVLKTELLRVTDSHFTSRRSLINNKQIQEFISTLKPLSNTVMQIQQVCDDPDLSIKDLIKVVKAGPIITGQILRAANSPMYGLKEIDTIEQAVSIFGMKKVQAIALCNALEDLKSVNLTMYGINETVFSNVAALRLALIEKWCLKERSLDISILSITAVLGNIGQLLIARELLKNKKSEEFHRIVTSESIQIAEEKIMHTTTSNVSSDIVYYWKLKKEIVDAIRFSDYPKNAPRAVMGLALANHIVYRLIGLDGKVLNEVPKRFINLLNKYGMNSDALQSALNEVNKINKGIR